MRRCKWWKMQKRNLPKRTTKKATLDHLPESRQDSIILARLLIEQDMPGGRTYPDLAHEFGLATLTVKRWYDKQTDARKQKVMAHYLHRKKQEQAEIAEGVGAALGEDIQQDFRWVLKHLKRLVEDGEKDGDNVLELSALRETSRVLEKLANLLGMMRKKVEISVDLNASPQFIELRDVIVRVLEDHPDAMVDFQRELHRLQHGGRVIEHQPISA